MGIQEVNLIWLLTLGKMTEPIKLFIDPLSPTSRIAWLYLLQSGVEHEAIEVLDEGKSREFQNGNPHRIAPLLQDEEYQCTVFDCPAVIFYIAEKYAKFSGFPIEKRPQIEGILCWASNSLYKSIGDDYVNQIRKKEGVALPDLEASKQLTEKAKEDIHMHLDTLEKRYLQKNKFLCGDKVSMADYYVAMMLSMLELVGFSFRSWPKLSTWMMSVKELGGDHWEFVSSTHNMRAMQRGSRRASVHI